jgi:hypothetical protein
VLRVRPSAFNRFDTKAQRVQLRESGGASRGGRGGGEPQKRTRATEGRLYTEEGAAATRRTYRVTDETETETIRDEKTKTKSCAEFTPRAQQPLIADRSQRETVKEAAESAGRAWREFPEQ